MFLGEYRHSLDAKGRVILPARFREELAEGAYMAKAMTDPCLFVYTRDEFEEVARTTRQQMREGSRAAQEAARSFFAGATDVEPDKQGRVAIPAHLRSFAHLDKEVVVAGVFARIEIWDAERWDEREARAEAASASADDLQGFAQ
ncbi:MAG: division/cell wall cluster transcriptional repressor MraZ [Acidimicrobiia bacterium]|nr:division/cell wall cluster transcriptional repressor MraZ [Acidimicrobiia bacterium]